MAYQVPKSNHPWRRYKDRVYEETELKIKRVQTKIKPVKLLVLEFAQSWDDIKVVTTVNGKEGEFRLVELSQSKQAAWLAGLLKRHYA